MSYEKMKKKSPSGIPPGGFCFYFVIRHQITKYLWLSIEFHMPHHEIAQHCACYWASKNLINASNER